MRRPAGAADRRAAQWAAHSNHQLTRRAEHHGPRELNSQVESYLNHPARITERSVCLFTGENWLDCAVGTWSGMGAVQDDSDDSDTE